MTDTPPTSLGGYTLVELIGRGGMGEVWRAERVGAGGVRRRAAVKRILPIFQRDPILRERFVAEARITSRLEHPNIVQVLHFDDQPEPYLVLEYVDGLSLADLLRRASKGEAKIPLAAALYMIAEAADALDYAHRKTDDSQRPLEIVHRDVSPPNILVSFDGAVKVNDFGVARAVDNIVRTQVGLSVGKIVYMAPEQALGETVDRRADVFALAIVMWELLTLRPLMARNNTPAAMLETLRRCQFAAPSSLVPGIPSSVDAIVREGLSRDPLTRTASAGRMAKALRMALHDVAPGFDRRDLANAIRDAFPELAGRSSSERGTLGGSARDPQFDISKLSSPRSTPAVAASLAPAASGPIPSTKPDGSSYPPAATAMPGQRVSIAPQMATLAAAPPFPTPTVSAAPPLVLASPPRRRSRTWIIVLIVVVLLGGLVAGAAWWMWGSQSDDSTPSPSASASLVPSMINPSPSTATQPPAVTMQATYQAMLPGLVAACVTLLTNQSPHGSVSADVSFLAAGSVQTAAVRSNTGNTADDATLASCVENAMKTWTAPASDSGVAMENLTATF